MHAHTRLIAAAAFALVATTALGSAQGGAPPAQTPPPAQPPAGRGAGRGADPAQAGQGGGGRRGGFYQYVRPLADADVIARGKGLYEANCASCHAVDLRGTADGKNPNLLRSGTALSDKQGEQIGGAIARHTPSITLVRGYRRHLRVHPQRPRDDGGPGEPAWTQSDERRVERARG